MAAIDRVNGDVHALATLYSTNQLAVYEINPAGALTASTQSGGSGTAITKGTAEQVADELQPLMFETKSDGDVMIAIMDGHATDADDVKARVDQVLGVSNTTVTKQTTLLGLA